VADYLTFWQTNTVVFRREVESSQLFYSAAMRPKLERLLLQCLHPSGLLLLIGNSGTGKSTILKWLYETLAVAKYEVLLTTLVRQEAAMGWLTPRLAEFMGVALPGMVPGSDLTPSMRRTAAAFDEIIAEDRRLLVAIDAAHRLSNPEACGEISAYLNLQALAGSCATFLLAGDRRLKHLIQSVPELNTRVAFSLEITPFSRQDTGDYIAHRLRVANVAATFAGDAVDLIHDISVGVAAAIDNLAEACLMEAAITDQRQITRDTVQTAVAHIYGDATNATIDHHPSAASYMSAKPAPASATSPAWLATSQNPALATAAPTSSKLGAKVLDIEEAKVAAADSGIKLTSLFKSEPGRNRP